MKEKVIKFIQEQMLINENDKILVALSGGPDSVCLLHILYDLKDVLKIQLAAAHVNHMLRGKDSERDQEFTKNLCNELKIEYYCKKVDIDIIAKEKNISHELAGREERYKFFEEIIEREKYNKVAIAHNLNDNAETVLMRIMRGSGLEGLIGIKAKRGDKIIRPILCLNRDEIEKYISSNNIATCLDKTNLEKDYSRNKVRLDLIPYMKENFNNEIISTLNRMSNVLDIDNDFIENEVQNVFEDFVSMNVHDITCINKELFSKHSAIVTRVIKRCLIVTSGSYMNFESKHILEVINLASFETGKKIHLPNGLIAENVYGDIFLKKKDELTHEKAFEVFIKKENLNNLEVEFTDYSVKFEIILNKNNKQISNNSLIKYFDYDKIKEDIEIRTRKDGDKFKPLGMKGSKKLKDIFINLKIPREERELIPLVCFDSEIAWVVGYRVSETYKICSETQNILKISVNRKE